jgi:hypothetical protein
MVHTFIHLLPNKTHKSLNQIDDHFNTVPGRETVGQVSAHHLRVGSPVAAANHQLGVDFATFACAIGAP